MEENTNAVDNQQKTEDDGTKLDVISVSVDAE